METGGAIFTLTDIDLSPLTSTISANAGVIITAGVTMVLIKYAVPLIPSMLAKVIKRG